MCEEGGAYAKAKVCPRARAVRNDEGEDPAPQRRAMRVQRAGIAPALVVITQYHRHYGDPAPAVYKALDDVRRYLLLVRAPPASSYHA